MIRLKDFIMERSIGGNSGYVGYSMSVRAANARDDGRYPKTDFKKVYGISDKVLKVLVDLGIISDNEWHHTSKFGNKTTFYGWASKPFQLYYEANKPIVLQRIKRNELDLLEDEFLTFEEEYNVSQQRVQDKLSKLLDAYKKYRDDYKIKNNKFEFDGVYNASNGCVVKQIEGEGLVAFRDGERLSRRKGSAMRDIAIAELKSRMEEWKQGMMTYSEFLSLNYDGIVKDIMGNDISRVDEIIQRNLHVI